MGVNQGDDILILYVYDFVSWGSRITLQTFILKYEKLIIYPRGPFY